MIEELKIIDCDKIRKELLDFNRYLIKLQILYE